MHDVLRFWLDRGVDGVRADVIHCIGKDPDLPDDPPSVAGIPHSALNDVPVTHERLRAIRRLFDGYPGDRVIVGEVYLLSTEAVATYYGDGDELHLAFNFPPLYALWQQGPWTECIERTEDALSTRGRLAHLGALQPRQPAPPDPVRPGCSPARRGSGLDGAALRGPGPGRGRPAPDPPGHPLPLPGGGARTGRRGDPPRPAGRPRGTRRVPGPHPVGRDPRPRLAHRGGCRALAALPARHPAPEPRRARAGPLVDPPSLSTPDRPAPRLPRAVARTVRPPRRRRGGARLRADLRGRVVGGG